MYELMLYMYFKHTYRILEVFMEQNLSQYKIFYEVAKAGNISKAEIGRASCRERV